MKILVVVDYQKDFVDGALGFPGAELLDSRIVSKINEYADNNDMIVFTMDTHFKDYLDTREGKQLPIPHCIYDSEGWNLYGEVGKRLNDSLNFIMIKKSTFGVSPDSLVDGSIFFEELKYRGGKDAVTSIELCGLVTNMCVISNVATFQACFPDAQIIVDSNCVDSFDKGLHNATLDVLRGMQVEVK